MEGITHRSCAEHHRQTQHQHTWTYCIKVRVVFVKYYYYSCVSTEGRRNGFLGIISNSDWTRQWTRRNASHTVKGLTCTTTAVAGHDGNTEISWCRAASTCGITSPPVDLYPLQEPNLQTLSQVLLLFPLLYLTLTLQVQMLQTLSDAIIKIKQTGTVCRRPFCLFVFLGRSLLP